MQPIVTQEPSYPARDDADANSEMTVPGNRSQEDQDAKQRWNDKTQGGMRQGRSGGVVGLETTPPANIVEIRGLALA